MNEDAAFYVERSGIEIGGWFYRLDSEYYIDGDDAEAYLVKTGWCNCAARKYLMMLRNDWKIKELTSDE